MFELLFEVISNKLHLRREADFIQIAGNRAHIGGNGHLIVVQHHHQVGVGQVAGVVNRF